MSEKKTIGSRFQLDRLTNFPNRSGPVFGVALDVSKFVEGVVPFRVPGFVDEASNIVFEVDWLKKR